jgi:hypothetical protein
MLALHRELLVKLEMLAGMVHLDNVWCDALVSSKEHRLVKDKT